MQQMRKILQSRDVVEPSQTARVRCRALRGVPHLQSQIQAQVRLERSHRCLREKNESDDTQESLRLKKHARKNTFSFSTKRIMIFYTDFVALLNLISEFCYHVRI